MDRGQRLNAMNSSPAPLSLLEQTRLVEALRCALSRIPNPANVEEVRPFESDFDRQWCAHMHELGNGLIAQHQTSDRLADTVFIELCLAPSSR